MNYPNSPQNPHGSQSEPAVVDMLSTYFAQRGHFLAQVILADLLSSPYLPASYRPTQGSHAPQATRPNAFQVPMMPPNPMGHGAQANGFNPNGVSPNPAQGSGQYQGVPNPVTPQPTTGTPATVLASQSVASGQPVASQPVAVSGKANDAGTEAAPALSKSTILDMLIALVVEQTGFPADSIEADAQLLDDLNLDSIKSAEVVAQVAKQLGVEGNVDPAAFANASLEEVAAALADMVNAKSGSEAATLPSVASSASPAAERQAQPAENDAPAWVRNFAVEYLEEDRTSISDQEAEWQNTHLFPVDNWTQARVVIVADTAEVTAAQSVQTALQQKGATVQTVTFAELETRSLIQSPEFTHYIAVMPQAADPSLSDGDRLQKTMDQMYAIAAPPQASKTNRDYISISYLQFGGGHFGKLNQIHNIDQGCLIGFASTVHLERPDMKVRVIDLPQTTLSTKLMEEVLADIAQPDGYLAVGYDNQLTRRIPRPVIQDRTQYQTRPIHWTADDVILVTGGAKGITAECVLAFAQVTGVKMALVGSSAHPQDNPTGKSSPEIARTLRRFQQDNLVCNYYSCDVADPAAVKALVEQVEADLGQVTGVIHGAAVNRARRADNCPVELARPEISPKVMGMFALCDIFEQRPPKLFAGISSIGAVIGLPGNSWYSFSNEVLDQMLRRFGQAHPETEVFSVAYSVWADVGMGARMGTVKNLGRMGIKAIPMQDGVDRFVQLMFNNPGDTQVVITSSLGGVQTLGRGFDTWRVKRVPPAPEYRFIENLEMIDPNIEMVVRTHLTLEKDSYVKDHIYNGTYLFPTVFGLEAMAQVAAYVSGQSEFQSARIEDIRLERPIVVDANNGVTIELRADMPERESADVPQKVLVEIRTEQTGFAKAHFAATFVLGACETTSVDPIEQPSQPLGLNPHAHLYGGLLWQGKRFQRLQRIDGLNEQQMIFATQRGVEAIAPDQPFDRADGPFILGDPYCRDSLLQSVQPMVPQDIGLPIGINRIDVYNTNATTAQSCRGMATGQERQGKNYNTAVVMTDDQGTVVERLDGYQVRMVEHRPENPTIEDLLKTAVQALVHEVENEITTASTNVDEQELLKELRLRARALNVIIPQVSLTPMAGLHQLSAEERHQQELPVFRKTVNDYLNTTN